MGLLKWVFGERWGMYSALVEHQYNCVRCGERTISWNHRHRAQLCDACFYDPETKIGGHCDHCG